MQDTLILSALGCLAAMSLSSPLNAQAASSKNYFVVSVEFGNGANGTSTNYRLYPALGNGVVPQRSSSSNYIMVGGHSATLDVKTTGRPWLAGVLPRFVTPRGAANLALWGTELNLGPTPTIKIGGQIAALGTRSQQLITSKLPTQPVTGWRPVEVSNGFGTTILPRGIGILPMIFTEPSPAPNVAFQMVFKGSQNDMVVWAASALPQAPLPLGGFVYGLAINPGAMVILPGFTIPGASGEFRFPIPAAAYLGPVYVQALFGSSNPGYAPGGFSNVVVF